MAERGAGGKRMIKWEYSEEDLRAIWEFVRGDFDGFIDLLKWLESLSPEKADEQLASARTLASERRSAKP